MYKQDENKIKYKVKAVCFHIGQERNKGHYTVLGQRGDQVRSFKKWYLFNDNKVVTADFNEIDKM